MTTNKWQKEHVKRGYSANILTQITFQQKRPWNIFHRYPIS